MFSSSDYSGLERLEEQLFLIAYRAILFHQDVLISLQESLSLPVQERNTARRSVRARLHRIRSNAVSPVASAVDLAKSEYDARLARIHRRDVAM